MSTNATAVDALALTLREQATRAHNARREQSRLQPVAFPAWHDIPIDQREGWRAVARHVLGNYSLDAINREALLTAVSCEIWQRVGGANVSRAECETLARDVLALADRLPVEAKT